VPRWYYAHGEGVADMSDRRSPRMAKVAKRRTSNPTPGNSQYQPAQGAPRHAPTIPPIIMQADANKPMFEATTAKLEPESDIIKLGNTVIWPRNAPTNNTAARFPTQHIKYMYVCRCSVAVDDGSTPSWSVNNGSRAGPRLLSVLSVVML